MSDPTREQDPLAGLLKRGRALLALGRPREAIPWLQKAIAADPHDLLARCDLALALFRLGEHREAIRAAEQAAVIDPDHAWPHYLRTLAYLGLGKRKPALLAAREAVRLDPAGPDALYALALAQLENRKRSEARATAERLREAAPGEARSHDLLGRIARRQRRWNDAEAHYRHALALEPESVTAIAGLADAREHRGKPREAIELLQQAVRLSPDDPSLAWQMVHAVDRFRIRFPALVILGLIVVDVAAALAIVAGTVLFVPGVMDSFLLLLWLGGWFGLLAAAHVLFLRRRLRRALPAAVVTLRDVTWKRWEQQADLNQLVATVGLPLTYWYLAARAARFVRRRWQDRLPGERSAGPLSYRAQIDIVSIYSGVKAFVRSVFGNKLGL